MLMVASHTNAHQTAHQRVFIALLTIQIFLIYPQASLWHVKKLKLLFFRNEKVANIYERKRFSVELNPGPIVLHTCI